MRERERRENCKHFSVPECGPLLSLCTPVAVESDQVNSEVVISVILVVVTVHLLDSDQRSAIRKMNCSALDTANNRYVGPSEVGHQVNTFSSRSLLTLL